MTLKSVVLPAPFGPMMPSRSPARTSRLTSRTAVRPPKRFVTRSSVSTDSPGRSKASGEPDQSLGGEPDDEDEGRAVDDEIDPGESGLHARERGAQVRLERRDQHRAEKGAEGRAAAGRGGRGPGPPPAPAVKPRQRLVAIRSTCENAIVERAKYGPRRRFER